ncbi:MAG: hypothetical protein A4E28_00384 [Methanocella sp. PtaU1.Bin125]|nr:MAG: hypothetical protein A4E28_00384 [Methanocella sp. PtaU1.Bin125]
MKIGSVVQVRTFSEYVVRTPVDRNDGYVPASGIAPGTYVSIKAQEGRVIGIVTNAIHSVKEDYLPYLPEGKQEVFLPYATDYRSSYLVVTGIGNVQEAGPAYELRFTPGINDLAEVMEPEEIRAFHLCDGKASFAYYRRLSQAVDPATLICAIDNAARAMPECAPMLKALKRLTEKKL